MAESTLAPTPSFNPNIPIITIGGGKKHSYNDPNSPESILKKVTTLQVQTAVDTKYDVAQSPYHVEEPFTNQISSPDIIRILLGCIVLVFILLVVFKRLKFLAKTFLLVLAVLLSILVIHVYVRNVNDI